MQLSWEAPGKPGKPVDDRRATPLGPCEIWDMPKKLEVDLGKNIQLIGSTPNHVGVPEAFSTPSSDSEDCWHSLCTLPRRLGGNFHGSSTGDACVPGMDVCIMKNTTEDFLRDSTLWSVWIYNNLHRFIRGGRSCKISLVVSLPIGLVKVYLRLVGFTSDLFRVY